MQYRKRLIVASAGRSVRGSGGEPGRAERARSRPGDHAAPQAI